MKRFIDPAVVIFGFLAGLTMAAGANSEPVALLINQKAYGSLAPEIETYKRDVEKRCPVRLKVVQGDWKSPDEVRAEIKTLYQRANIAGAILVGAIPMHRFFMHGFPNPKIQAIRCRASLRGMGRLPWAWKCGRCGGGFLKAGSPEPLFGEALCHFQ